MNKWTREHAAQALALTSQEWDKLGFSKDPQVAPSSDIDVITERIVSLMAIRTVALLSTLDDYDDFSTTTICRSILLNDNKWPETLTPQIVQELRLYVKRILSGYSRNWYHNREHAYHVTISANKLLDMMINPAHQDNGHERHNTNGNNTRTTTNGHNHRRQPQHQHSTAPTPHSSSTLSCRTFGLRRDTYLQFTLVFAALIHDVQHAGISNRQLALEDDPISILYNDSSALEQQSLTIGFTEFLQPEFANYRKLIFPNRQVYAGFRKTVVNLVLATDIANPERMQITKDKWKAAFGDEQAHLLTEQQQQQRDRRESAITEITLPRQNNSSSTVRESRRRSIGSLFSDITVEYNLLNNALGDEASLSESSDRDEAFEDIDPNSNHNNNHNADGSHYRSCTPDSTIVSQLLQKIDESDKERRNSDPSEHDGEDNNNNNNNNQRLDMVMSSQDLGYSPATMDTKETNGGASAGGGSHQSAYSEGTYPLTSQPIAALRSRSMRTSRRGSTTNVSDGYSSMMRGNMRRASMSTGDDMMKRLQRRLSAASAKTTGDLNAKRYRHRLGIMRSVDLGGETIENYSRKGSICSAASFENEPRGKRTYHLEEFDQPDELRATVVLETMLLCCDVAHNLQGWDHMLKWSHKLYWELHEANKSGRGFDPSSGWFVGQTGFLRNYMLPLAQKLDRTGVFGLRHGQLFGNTTQSILDAWEEHGEEVTSLLLSKRVIDLHPFR
ncbi:cAMP-specific 3',5'-cyclic phosphodiesterase 4D [Seminavis robusta]|uniref:cAMP-specific 3',5'-cyclic phosphodiesterase 4D n=1 Tax=Seminavis robusta TaxID=568900 RepID=A0A9N8EEU6_9STRA|nr:cAMP-specific 3',5'-cyclic phosphodiesterase 4D [Seminavis robusta]|eukprot:Sro897_g217460.1 cAMP-specific 3',5'-cyclic phosphodiesterase 4D (729) ;mRNA; f:12120-14306